MRTAMLLTGLALASCSAKEAPEPAPTETEVILSPGIEPLPTETPSEAVPPPAPNPTTSRETVASGGGSVGQSGGCIGGGPTYIYRPGMNGMPGTMVPGPAMPCIRAAPVVLPPPPLPRPMPAPAAAAVSRPASAAPAGQ